MTLLILFYFLEFVFKFLSIVFKVATIIKWWETNTIEVQTIQIAECEIAIIFFGNTNPVNLLTTKEIYIKTIAIAWRIWKRELPTMQCSLQLAECSCILCLTNVLSIKLVVHFSFEKNKICIFGPKHHLGLYSTKMYYSAS
jgi:hypothetical protein